MGVVPDRHGEEGAEPKAKVLSISDPAFIYGYELREVIERDR